MLSIKLHQPAPPPKHVRRPALIQQLNEGLAFGRPVTLVSAPAGFGKTTCITEWLADLALPTAWLSLDAEDNDPGRFFSYLLTALKRVGETLGGETFLHAREVEGVFGSGQLPPLEVVAAALLTDIADLAGTGEVHNPPARFLLVLDDFHLIQERYILTVFEKLVANLFLTHLPQPLHLVLLTREDPALPLARLRANNQLTEIRAADLRFSGAEAGCFLNEMMGLGLAESDIFTLAERTEGWIAGLQLAGLSVRGRSDPSRFIHSLSGSHRFILSYLTEEVLNRQTADVQQFLLDTAILDQLSGDLCDAVTGRSDSHVLLEQLCSANLFLIPLDDDQRWYRYHHLFADLLRSRQAVLHGEQTAELHRRASRWFARACAESSRRQDPASSALNDRAALASEAVRYALAGKDYPHAVQLIESYATEFIDQWYAKTVYAWMQALPPEWSAQSPRINLAFARMHLVQGTFAQAFPYLERLQGVFSDPQSGETEPALKAEWLALQSTLYSGQGKPAEALELAQQALKLTSEKDIHARTQIYLALAVAYQQLDQPDQAVEAFQKLILLGRASGSAISELLGIAALGLMFIERGHLHRGFDLALQGAERVERSGVLPPILGGIYGELGQICYHWNQLERAEYYLQRAAQVSALVGFSDAEIYFGVMRSRLAQLRGDMDAAGREMHKAADLMRADAPVVVREEVIAQQVNVLLAQNQLAAAEQILFQEIYSLQGKYAFPELIPGQSIPYPQGVLYLSALRIQLYRARLKSQGIQPDKSVPGGTELADGLLAALLQRQYVPLALQTLLLRAQLHAALDDPQASLADFTAALDLAEPEGYLSDFVVEGQPAADALARLLEPSQPGSPRAQFIRKILDAFPKSQERDAIPEEPEALVEQTSLIEPLTDRELDVLRLMAEGRTYEDIAGRLVVSINTVRSHVKSIYGKLGVNNRTAAIETARQVKVL